MANTGRDNRSKYKTLVSDKSLIQMAKTWFNTAFIRLDFDLRLKSLIRIQIKCPSSLANASYNITTLVVMMMLSIYVALSNLVI